MTTEIYRNSVRTSNSSPVLDNVKNLVNVNSIDGYSILGHGNNGNETTIVPEGSIVVAKAHPGDDMMGLETELLKEKQKILNIQNIQTTLNPLKNAKNLYKLFGSVSIFTGGQTCPNFYYSLIAIHPRPNKKMRLSVSGIIKIPVGDLNLLEEAYVFDENMTIRTYKNNPDNFKIGSLFRLCDNSILKLDTVDNTKKKILSDKLQLYKDILSYIDNYKSDIIENNEDDLLVLLGIRKQERMHIMPMVNSYSTYYSIIDELTKVLKTKYDALSKNERNFYTNISKSKMRLDSYIDDFKHEIPAIISSLETDIEKLKNRTLEEYVNDYISTSPDDTKLTWAIDDLKLKLNISQSTIFENSLKPSITYNFVCRVNGNSTNWYNNHYKATRSGIVNNQRKYYTPGRSVYNTRTISKRIKNARNSSNGSLGRNTRKLSETNRIGLVKSVRNQISEAELQRKGQIRNVSNLLYKKNASDA